MYFYSSRQRTKMSHTEEKLRAHVQYTRTDSGRQTLKVDPSTGSQVVTLLTEVNSATGSQVKDDGSYFSGGDGS